MEPETRVLAALDKLEQRGRRYLAIGAFSWLVALILFAGLSSSLAGVLLGLLAAMGGPFLLLWDERMSRLGRQAIWFYLAVGAFWFIAFPLGHGWSVADVGKIVRWVALGVGPVYAWSGLKVSRMLSAARGVLGEETFDVRLETRVFHFGVLNTKAWLWSSDSERPTPLAWFGWQQSEPQLVALDMVPAKAYGAPKRGALVVVHCSETVLVGRVKRSRFGELPAQARPVSPLVAWLWKPRRLF